MKKEGPRHLQPGLGMPPLPGRGWGGFSKNFLSENPSPLLVKKKKKKNLKICPGSTWAQSESTGFKF